MDEVEFKMAYNEACKHAERVTAPDSKTALMYILQLLNDLNNRITEIQDGMEDF